MVYSKEEVTILEKGKTTKQMLLLDGTVVNIEFLYGTFLMTISFIINNIKLCLFSFFLHRKLIIIIQFDLICQN